MIRFTSSHAHETDQTRAARTCFAQTLVVVLIGVVPLPASWVRARSALESVRSNELNRSDRESVGGGYYEGLIGHGDSETGGQNDLALRLLGKPAEWSRFQAANVTHSLPDADFLQFELKPNVNRMLFGHPFTTNAHGMRDRDYSIEKPEGVYRIAVLGSSMDMGWGIGTNDTYVNLLEEWLNVHAARVGIDRRFEVLNFAVAAYSPLQRLEAYRRKVKEFRPDLVLYSATTLDTRLMEIHLCDLFRAKAEMSYDFLRQALTDAGVTPADLALDADERLIHKDLVKKKLRPFYWPIYDAAIGRLAAECRSEGTALAAMVIPRVGKADAPGQREESLSRLQAIAMHHAIPLWNLTATFDGQDPVKFAINAWDDHPNALGHRRLFLAMTRTLVDDPTIYRTMFPHEADPHAHPTAAEPPRNADAPLDPQPERPPHDGTASPAVASGQDAGAITP